MKKALLLLALALGGASAASGQAPSQCAGRYQGRVRGVRVETARFTKVGGKWVEGPRRLSAVTAYSEDLLKSEHTVYDEAGNVSDIFVRTCYESGGYAEIASYDGQRKLRWRQLFSADGNDIQRLDAAGRLQQREVLTRDGAGRTVKRRTYDGAGRLLREELTEVEGQSVVVKTLDAEGRLLSKSVNSGEADGRGRRETDAYAADGSVAVSDDTVVGSGARQVDQARTFGPGGGRAESSTRREFDERGNVVRQTHYERNQATGELEPRAVSYHEITYF
jgi:hypothetical protein